MQKAEKIMVSHDNVTHSLPERRTCKVCLSAMRLYRTEQTKKTRNAWQRKYRNTDAYRAKKNVWQRAYRARKRAERIDHKDS